MKLLRFMIATALFGSACDALVMRAKTSGPAPPASSSSAMNRRAALGVPVSFMGVALAGASPALALRSVLDEGSQELFDQKQAKRNAPPPPPKTMQEMLGIEGKPGQSEAKFDRPKFERKADKEKREAAEKAAEAAGLNKPEAPKPKKELTAAQKQAQKEADEEAERSAAALARRRAAGL